MNIRKNIAKFVSGRKADLGMALVFLGLIIIPSGLLAYFSWHALKNERLISQERLQRSYNRIAFLAALQIDKQLESIEQRWIEVVERNTVDQDDEMTLSIIQSMAVRQPLISEFFYFTGPGKLIHPQRFETSSFSEAKLPAGASQSDEFQLFEKTVEHGEDLEYYSFDLEGALQVYTALADTLQTPQLRGVARSYVGRVLMKQGNWQQAMMQFEALLENYAELRDLNGMLLNLWAEFQIVICLESMERDQEAVQRLLELNQHLLEKSDAINTAQYSNFVNEINTLLPRLIASPGIENREQYEQAFAKLAETNKKQISQRFFVAFFNRKLNEAIIERRTRRSGIKYYSGEAADEPYLLGSIFLDDSRRPFVRGLIGLEIDLQALRQKLFPSILKNLNFSKDARLTLINQKGEIVLGETSMTSNMIASHTLGRPFDFWQVAIFLDEGVGPSPGSSWQTTIGLWMISLLFLSIFIGAAIFIRRAQREAYLSQMKSTFVSSLSHELRTPLASIKMLAELLGMQFAKTQPSSLEDLKQRGTEYLQVIRRESERLNRLIDNLLDFSRIERGTKEYNFEYEELSVLVHLAVDSIRPQIEANGFTVRFELDDDLPEVRVDADAIAQVFINLISNAMKYSTEKKELTIATRQTDGFLYVDVIDQGIGISAAHQQKVFDSFYRVDQKLNSTKQGGVGIGLTLVRQIVTDHGGTVSVKSAPGKGSTFTFTLPVANDAVSAEIEQQREEATPQPAMP